MNGLLYGLPVSLQTPPNASSDGYREGMKRDASPWAHIGSPSQPERRPLKLKMTLICLKYKKVMP